MDIKYKFSFILAAVVMIGCIQASQATLFQQLSRDFARNQMVQLLQRYPDLLYEIVKMQQMLMMQQYQQQAQFGNSLGQLNGNQQGFRPNGQQFGVQTVANGAGFDQRLPMRPQQQFAQQQQQRPNGLSPDELNRQTSRLAMS